MRGGNKAMVAGILFLSFAGCAAREIAPASDLVPLQTVLHANLLGESRQKAIQTLGEPARFTVKNGVEYLVYLVKRPADIIPYYVRLSGGKVNAQGVSLDFGALEGTTEIFTLRRNGAFSGETITIAPSDGAQTKLKKLRKLYDKNAVDRHYYEARKRELAAPAGGR